MLWFLKPFYVREPYWRIVLLCFGAATTFWLLNAFNKNYNNIRITYPIRFVYNQQYYIPLRPLPEEITINVSGKGWKLLRKYLMLNVQPAEIPIGGITRQKAVPASIFRPNVANALDGLQLNFIVTDSLRFTFDQQVKRKIPLAVDTTQLRVPANYALVSPIRITPKEVEFEGPASVLDSLPNPLLLKLPDTPLKQSFRSFLPIHYPFKALVKSDIVEAEIAFDVKPLLWHRLALAPTLLHPPKTGTVVLQPAAVTLQYGFVAEPAVPIDPTQFNLIADLTQVSPTDSMVTVTLQQKPGAVQRVSWQPLRVKVIRTGK